MPEKYRQTVWPEEKILTAVANLIGAPLAETTIASRTARRQVFLAEKECLSVKIQRSRSSDEIKTIKAQIEAVKALADTGIDLLAPIKTEIIDDTFISVSQLGDKIDPQNIDWGWLGRTIKQIQATDPKFAGLRPVDIDLATADIVQGLPEDPAGDGLPAKQIMSDQIETVINQYRQATKPLARVLCHGDPNLSNIVYLDKRPYLIDFDDFGPNYAVWDFSVVDDMNNFGWPTEEIEAFYQAWEDDPRQSPAWEPSKRLRTIRGALGNYKRALVQPPSPDLEQIIAAAAKRLAQSLLDESERDPDFVFSDVHQSIPRNI